MASGSLFVSGQPFNRYVSGTTLLLSHQRSKSWMHFALICSTAFSRSDKYGTMATLRNRTIDVSSSYVDSYRSAVRTSRKKGRSMLNFMSGNPYALPVFSLLIRLNGSLN
jgi:hypothetical protein